MFFASVLPSFLFLLLWLAMVRFEKGLVKTDKRKKQEPDIDDSLDVNLRAPILFSRIASVYLRQQCPRHQNGDSNTAETPANKSLTLVSSVAGFTEAPGLAVYSAGKHGVYGLMRALRKYVLSPPPSYQFSLVSLCKQLATTEVNSRDSLAHKQSPRQTTAPHPHKRHLPLDDRNPHGHRHRRGLESRRPASQQSHRCRSHHRRCAGGQATQWRSIVHRGGKGVGH